MYVGNLGAKQWICAIRGLPCAKRGSVLVGRGPRLRNPGIAHAGGAVAYVVLDCEAKDGIESTNSKPTLLEDQRKEREDILSYG